MPTLLRMPTIAAGTETAILSEWQVQEDVPFDKSDPIATVETDKAAVEIEAEEAGVILRFLVASGQNVEVGAPIALSRTRDEVVDDIDEALRTLGADATSVAGEADTDGPSEGPDEPKAMVPGEAAGNRRIFATPLVRRLARDANLDLATLSGSGPNGRVVRRDIEAVLGEATPTHETAAEPSVAESASAGTISVTHSGTGFTEVPHTRIRAAIAARLTESKRSTPHFYLTGSCRVDRLLALRGELNSDLQNKVSVNDLVVKAAARTHTLVPAMNVIWTEQAIRQFEAVDIAVAVASPRGLITPVVRDAARCSIAAISNDLRDLAARARDGKLVQREIEGGAFCISNLGMYGTQEFSAIINPPQSAILAVGAARSEPVVDDGAVAVATVMRVTMSVDHRAIDGSTAAEWMRAFIAIIENPLQILL